jgi:hypothetical protein
MTEAQLLGKIRYLARLYGWRRVYHTHDSRRSDPGFPDLVLVHPGQRRIVFAELKTATGRTTPVQDAWLADLAAAGAEVHLWRPADLQRTIPTVLRGLTPTDSGGPKRTTCPPPTQKEPA